MLILTCTLRCTQFVCSSVYKLLVISHVIFNIQIRDHSRDAPKHDADVQPQHQCT